jgi:hypothetical protein
LDDNLLAAHVSGFFQSLAKCTNTSLNADCGGAAQDRDHWQRCLLRISGKAAGDALRAPFVLGDRRALAALFSGAGATARFPSTRELVEAELRGWLPVMGIVLPEPEISLILAEAENVLAPTSLAMANSRSVCRRILSARGRLSRSEQPFPSRAEVRPGKSGLKRAAGVQFLFSYSLSSDVRHRARPSALRPSFRAAQTYAVNCL